MNKKQPIAIIGGMGPEASAYMYQRMIDFSINTFAVKQNDEFPEIILDSIPVPDFISDDKKRKKALQILQDRVAKLNLIDLSCIGIACNTAHILYAELQLASKAPIISMIDGVVAAVVKDNIFTVGLVGTPSLLSSGLYQKKLATNGIKTVIPTVKQIKLLENIIRNVIAGSITKRERLTLLSITDSLKKQGAEGIILGCTELPLVFPKKYRVPVYNSVDILAERLLRNYYK